MKEDKKNLNIINFTNFIKIKRIIATAKATFRKQKH